MRGNKMITNAVFVDAGYMYRMGADLAFAGEVVPRSETSLDVGYFTQELIELIETKYPSDDHLRTYWYDGARPFTPWSDEHTKVAFQPSVKLRLGIINDAGSQKGVDTLIIRDLMTLSQERSIQRAIVISGDEDLREAIEFAQDRGVRVTLLVFPNHSGQMREVSQWLKATCDEVLQMAPQIFKSTMSRRASPVRQSVSVKNPTETTLTIEAYTLLERAAEDFGVKCAQRLTSDQDVASVLRSKPSVPPQYDGPLLREVAEKIEVETLSYDQKQRIREAFWDGFEHGANQRG
jgi:NYN domain